MEYLCRRYEEMNVIMRVNCRAETMNEIPGFLETLPSVIRQRAKLVLAEIYQCQSFLTEDPRHLPTSSTIVKEMKAAKRLHLE